MGFASCTSSNNDLKELKWIQQVEMASLLHIVYGLSLMVRSTVWPQSALVLPSWLFDETFAHHAPSSPTAKDTTTTTQDWAVWKRCRALTINTANVTVLVFDPQFSHHSRSSLPNRKCMSSVFSLPKGVSLFKISQTPISISYFKLYSTKFNFNS